MVAILVVLSPVVLFGGDLSPPINTKKKTQLDILMFKAYTRESLAMILVAPAAIPDVQPSSSVVLDPS